MIAGIYNIKDHTKGDTFDGVEFELLTESNDPLLDLSNVSIKSQFRKRNRTGEVVKEITNGSGITVIDAVNTKFQIDKFIIDWHPDIYYYDIEFTLSDGTIKTYISGVIKIVQDVTRNG